MPRRPWSEERRISRSDSLAMRAFAALSTSTAAQTCKFARLAARALVCVEGADAARFLQGLLTGHVGRVELGGGGLHAALLSPRGRILHDVFLYPLNRPDGRIVHPPAFVLETDARQGEAMLRH